MGIEDGEEVQAKGLCNIFNKIITENFSNLKRFAHSCTGSLQDSKQMSKIEPLHDILSLKQEAQKTKTIEGCKREKNNI
jgi:hypothetical protein